MERALELHEYGTHVDTLRLLRRAPKEFLTLGLHLRYRGVKFEGRVDDAKRAVAKSTALWIGMRERPHDIVRTGPLNAVLGTDKSGSSCIPKAFGRSSF